MGDVLAIDAGKTGLRAARFTDAGRSPTVRGPGIANVAGSGGLGQIRAVLTDTLAQLPGLARIDGACIGLTGVLRPDHHAVAVGAVLTEIVAAERIVVTSDVVTNYCGALGAVPGVVIAAGTGAIALGVGPRGELARVDGWGFLLDDAGSAFSIGRSGLRDALRAVDGRGGSPALYEAVISRFGSPNGLVDRVYGSANPARVIAGFAEDVARVADMGDPTAAALLADAASELAAGVVAAARVLEPATVVAVSWQGGVFSAGPSVVEPFEAAVRAALPNASFQRPAGDALDGAAILARRNAWTVLDGLLDIHERARP